jgi:hypothetical protein
MPVNTNDLITVVILHLFKYLDYLTYLTCNGSPYESAIAGDFPPSIHNIELIILSLLFITYNSQLII